MSGILVLYHSRTGNTEKMAKAVAEGVKEMGVDVSMAKAAGFKTELLKDFAGIAVGSPTYYGTMAWEVKKVFDESVRFHGELAGKVGGAFTSSANLAGGNETTILDIVKAMLVHGMVVQGTHSGDHYGPVAIGAPDERAIKGCKALGRRLARLVKATLDHNLTD
ncbi:MAG: flavodoxin family protein [Planctomycetota bacterium]|jgi:NAD(P)H dehydrogenase (quinone)